MDPDLYLKIQLLKKYYWSAIDYYDNEDLKSAEKEFIKVLKPVFSKVTVREVSQTNIPYIKKELLDSMYHVGLIYCRDESYQSNYAKAAAIYQYCARFAQKYDVTGHNIDSNFAFNKAHEIEAIFLRSIGINCVEIGDKIEEYQNKLSAFRVHIKCQIKMIDENIDLRAKQIENMHNEITDFFFNCCETGLIQNIFSDCVTQLGRPPSEIQYAIIALGSFAGGTATPWSDLEFAILISRGDEKYKQYFRNLTKLFHIKIVNLGESQLRWIGIEALNNFKTANEEDDWFWDNVMPYGLSLDGAHWHACEMPLGRKNYKAKIITNDHHSVIIDKPDFELILTPADLVEFQQEQIIGINNWADTDPHLVQSLRSFSLIMGSQNLVDECRTMIKDAVSIDIVRKRTIKILREDVNNYHLKLNLSFQPEYIDVKKDIYRLIDRIINGMANYYNIIAQNGQKSINLWNIIDEMKNTKIINKIGAEHFKTALSIATEFRLRTYINNLEECNKELISISIYKSNVNIMRYFYQVMLRIQELIKMLCVSKTQAEQLLATDRLFIDDDYTVNLISAELRVE